MHGKGIRNYCFTVLICFYSPRGNNGKIDTFVGFSSLKRMLLLQQALMPMENLHLLIPTLIWSLVKIRV
jgi:hypothetical protein